jgi:CheY-like chemotaxis protein
MRCLIVDDDAVFRTALRHLLERDGATVSGIASNGAEAVERAGALRPDVVLVDVRLGAENGFEVARRIDERAAGAGLHPAIVLVSTHAEDELAPRLAAEPEFGFLDKTTVSVPRIRAVIGETGTWRAGREEPTSR